MKLLKFCGFVYSRNVLVFLIFQVVRNIHASQVIRHNRDITKLPISWLEFLYFFFVAFFLFDSLIKSEKKVTHFFVFSI